MSALPLPVTEDAPAFRVHWLFEMVVEELGAAAPATLLPSSAIRLNRTTTPISRRCFPK